MPVSARQLDITKLNDVKQIILDIEGDQNVKRKQDAWITKQCKEGNQLEYVKKELVALYPKTHSKFRHGDINIPEKVNSKVAKAYKQPPIRSLENDTEDKALTEIYDENHFDRAFKEADSIFNLHKYVCMWVTFQNPDNALGIKDFSYVPHALAPYEYDLVRDEVTGVPVIFIKSGADTDITKQAGGSDGVEQFISESQSDTNAQTKIYTLWSDDHYVRVVAKLANGKLDKENVTVAFIERKPNVLERLPITYLQKDTAVDYPVKQNIASQTISWNVSFSDLKTAAATQGHGQLVILHPEGQETKDVHMGMHTAITLPQSKKPDAPPTDAKYISATPDLAGQLDVLKFDIVNILDDHGIKAKGAIEGGVDKFASGFDRLLSEADVQDHIEDNQNLYKDSLEQGVFQIVKASEIAMKQNTFSSSDKVGVTFEKPKVLISDKETLDNIEKRELLGTILPWEKHIILNPNLSEEDAKKREEEIQTIRKQRLKEMQDMVDEDLEDDE